VALRRAFALAVLACVPALALSACGGAPAAEAEPEQAPPSGPQEIVEALRGGGYVLYLRHTATDMTKHDAAGAPLEDCDRQRNLTEAGRDEARRIGEALRALEIPTDQVVSSEYCRCLETAKLAFDPERVVPEPLITGLPGRDEEEYESRVEALRELIGERPAGKTNRVLVGHVKNLEAAAELTVEEGETAVFEPLGAGEFRLLGRFSAATWPQLADALASG
jgi:phosphohistidine phosphatase SixA